MALPYILWSTIHSNGWCIILHLYYCGNVWLIAAFPDYYTLGFWSCTVAITFYRRSCHHETIPLTFMTPRQEHRRPHYTHLWPLSIKDVMVVRRSMIKCGTLEITVTRAASINVYIHIANAYCMSAVIWWNISTVITINACNSQALAVKFCFAQ